MKIEDLSACISCEFNIGVVKAQKVVSWFEFNGMKSAH